MPLYSYYILHWFVSQSTLYLSEEYKTRCQRVLKNSTDLQDKISGVSLQQAKHHVHYDYPHQAIKPSSLNS